ncbi:MAG: hypothetical protein QXP29_06610 [Candidatus Nezhaarchaeales archaeon]
MGISCNVVDCELEKLLLELYDIIVKLDTKFLYMYTLLKFGQAFLEAPEEMISMFFQEVVKLGNGIIVILIPSSYIEKFIEEIPS